MTCVAHNVTAPDNMSHNAWTAVTMCGSTLSHRREKCLVNTFSYANLKVFMQYGGVVLQSRMTDGGGSAQRRSNGMLFITGMLTGMAVLVLYEVISEGIGSSQKLHDRYHE